ncbi:MAG: hypothetical protein U1C74_31305 [Phenylobacterium sp.]|nr:hypothetical protein [Phenylobacterium sp.]
MGLDLLVESGAKPGHEAEWRRAMQSSFEQGLHSEAEIARFREISIPPYERLDPPRVGRDEAANAWILGVQNATTPDEIATVLRDFDGYFAVALVECDGVPKYSHGGLYDGLDETSFRGSFLTACGDVLGHDLIEDAWNHKMPDAAVSYGEALLEAARAASAAGAPPPKTRKSGFLAKLFARDPPPGEPFEEQLKIVEAAGRWYVFWGERGHAIRAWS